MTEKQDGLIKHGKDEGTLKGTHAIINKTERNTIGNLLSVKVTPYGGIGTQNRNLTGSCNILEVQRENPLNGKTFTQRGFVDFGLNQGNENDRNLNSAIKSSIEHLNFGIFTHPHVDHVGGGPSLVKGDAKFDGTMFSTHSTKDLLEPILIDSAKLQQTELYSLLATTDSLKAELKRALIERDQILGNSGSREIKVKVKPAKFFRNHRHRKISFRQKEDDYYNSQAGRLDYIHSLLSRNAVNSFEDIEKVNADKISEMKEKILYTTKDVSKFMSYIRGISFNSIREILPGLQLSFHNAGHILGSAQTLLQVEDGKGGSVNLGFSGDIGRWHEPGILGRPDVISSVLDYYQIEATYGGRFHEKKEISQSNLENIINRTYSRGGKIVMPAFVNDRLQNVVAMLVHMQDDGRIPKDIPIYMDGGYVDDINRIFTNHDIDGYYRDVLTRPNVRLVSGKDMTQEFLRLKGTAIIVAPSGMLTGGSIMKYISLLEFSKNSLVLTGYQADGLGRRISDGYRELLEIPSGGVITKITAEVLMLKSLSSHGDHNDLLSLAGELNFADNGILAINHGDPLSMRSLYDGFGTLKNVSDSHVRRMIMELENPIQIYQR